MLMRCGISSDISNLQRLNTQHNWIPNVDQIRPISDIIEKKVKFLENISKLYKTLEDYILDYILDLPSKICSDNKIYVPKENIIKKHIFKENMFPYNVADNTYHYVIWYTYKPESHKQIDADITKCIQEFLGNDNFDYVWYINPKMSITNSFHLQIFWHKI